MDKVSMVLQNSIQTYSKIMNFIISIKFILRNSITKPMESPSEDGFFTATRDLPIILRL